MSAAAAMRTPPVGVTAEMSDVRRARLGTTINWRSFVTGINCKKNNWQLQLVLWGALVNCQLTGWREPVNCFMELDDNVSFNVELWAAPHKPQR